MSVPLPHRLLPTTFNNVNRNTFDDFYDTVLNSVKNASYIAVDTEFTGLGKGRDAIDEFQLYQSHKEAAEKYSLLAFGLTVVQKVNNDAGKDVHYKVDNYNFTTLKRNGFFVESETGQFLTKSMFSFDDLFLNGIEYEPLRKSTGSKYSKLSKLWHEMIRIVNENNISLVVHNGFMDLVYIYESFIGILPDTLTLFLNAIAVLFTAGIFDTKHLTKHVANEQSNFLEYLFRKYDRLLEQRFNTDKMYFVFESNPPIMPTTTATAATTAVDITTTITTTITNTTITTIKNTTNNNNTNNNNNVLSPGLLTPSSSASSLPYCEEFASQGYCSKQHAESSQHDVNVILDHKYGSSQAISTNSQLTTTPPSSQLREMIGSNAHTAYYDAYMTSFIFCFLLHSLLPQQWLQAKNRLNNMKSNTPLFIAKQS